jgi:hypothetical protein
MSNTNLRQLTLDDIQVEPHFQGSDYVAKYDHARLTGALKRIFDLMSDGKYRTLSEIAHATGTPEGSVGAQLRNLKKAPFGSHGVPKRIRGNRSGGLWEYKLIVNEAGQ